MFQSFPHVYFSPCNGIRRFLNICTKIWIQSICIYGTLVFTSISIDSKCMGHINYLACMVSLDARSKSCDMEHFGIDNSYNVDYCDWKFHFWILCWLMHYELWNGTKEIYHWYTNRRSHNELFSRIKQRPNIIEQFCFKRPFSMSTLLYYRRLQLLAILLNYVFHQGLMNLVVVGSLIVHILCLVGLFHYTSILSFSTHIDFALVLFDTLFLVMIVLGQASKIHHKSVYVFNIQCTKLLSKPTAKV